MCSVPGKMKQFIADLHSGKLHREFHHGPDVSVAVCTAGVMIMWKVEWALIGYQGTSTASFIVYHPSLSVTINY